MLCSREQADPKLQKAVATIVRAARSLKTSEERRAFMLELARLWGLPTPDVRRLR